MEVLVEGRYKAHFAGIRYASVLLLLKYTLTHCS